MYMCMYVCMYVFALVSILNKYIYMWVGVHAINFVDEDIMFVYVPVPY